GDWVPLISAYPAHIDEGKQRKSFHSGYKSVDTSSNYSGDWYNDQYDEADTAHFADTYTLWIYPLPASVAGVSLQYYDITLTSPVWRDLPNTTLTGHGLAVSCTAIQPGQYNARLMAWDKNNQPVDLSSLADLSADGNWACFNITIKHGATLTTVVNTTATPQEIVRPIRHQTMDRWDNLCSSTTPLGNTTNYVYNGFNKVLSQTDPAVEVTHEDGRMETISPTKANSYSVTSYTMATRDANGKVTTYDRDNDGTTLKTTPPNGVYKKNVLDIYGRTVEEQDPMGHKTDHTYDRCDRKTSKVDACGWETHYRYNEINLKISMTNGNGETDRYDYVQPTSKTCCTHHWAPLNQLTLKIYDINGERLKEQYADGHTNFWTRDYFGNILTHTDFSGALYTNTYNYNMQVLSAISTGGDHGMYINPSNNLSEPVLPQNLKYGYDEAGNTIQILDDAQSLTTQYRYNLDGKRIRATFMGSDGHIHQATITTLNAANWIVESQDTITRLSYGYTPTGYRRYTIADIYWDNAWIPSDYESWFAYNEIDEVIIDRGKLIDGKIQIVSNQGTELKYNNAGWRSKQTTIDDGNRVEKTLNYLSNGLLSSISSTDGNNNTFQYDGKVSRRTKYTTKDTEQDNHYNANSWITSDYYKDNSQNMETNTKYDLTETGLVYHQVAQSNTLDHLDGYTDDLTTSYIGFDELKVARTSGTRTRMQGDTSSIETVAVTFNPNGYQLTVSGALEDSYRLLLTNSENRIVQKSTGDGKNEYYFYTPDGELIGECGDIPPDATVAAASPSYINFDLGYHSKIDNHFPPPAPDKYTVLEEDSSYADIAEKMYGDRTFADVIAQENGYNETDVPPVGMELTIPNLVSTSTHEAEAVYNENEIIGSLYPDMPMPNRTWKKPKKKDDDDGWFDDVFEAGIGAAIFCIVAPELIPFMPAVIGPTLAAVASGAIAGAASSLGEQAAAIALKDQKGGISWGAVAKNALFSAETYGLQNALPGLDGLQNMGVAGSMAASAEVGAAMQTVRLVTGEQRNFDWKGVVVSSAAAGLNTGMNEASMGINKAIGADLGFINSVASSEAQAALDHAVSGKAFNAEAVAANTLGTFMGQKAGEAAREWYDTYKIEKAKEEQMREVANNPMSRRKEMSGAKMPSDKKVMDDVVQDDSTTAKQDAALKGLEWWNNKQSARKTFSLFNGANTAGLGPLDVDPNVLPEAPLETSSPVLTLLSVLDGGRLIYSAGKALLGAAEGIGKFGLWGASASSVKSLGAQIGEVDFDEVGGLAKNRFKLLGEYDAYSPGLLSNRNASTFMGQKYSTYQLERDTIIYRAGDESKSLGEFFTLEKPTSELQVRIDKAVLPQWPGGGSSVINTGYEVVIPKGAVVHMGEIAPQGNIFLGGTQQVLIEKPWLNPEIKVINKFSLQEELLWNIRARK
ncbi:MAG: RHS repeat protein, partial [Gammaproteobacteria bacterium]